MTIETEHTPARVLVVDDEENQRTGLAGMIALWGYAVETATDGQDALEKLATFRAHVIVTDLNMPRMTGQELLQRLKEQGNAPVAIVQTAFGSLETALTLIHDLGALWFLEKPVQSQALRLLIERAVAQYGLAEHAERLERELGYHGILGEMTGGSSKMQEVFALPGDGADHRRKRHGQGTGGPRDPRVEPAPQRALCGHQLRGSAGNPYRERVVRPREGSLHGSPGTPRRLF